MRINRIEIVNFRNFQHCELEISENAVIVGENKIGKSNLLYALRLVLDPRMSDSERQLRLEDFWDGLPRPLSKNDVISISVDFADFDNNTDLIALLADYAIAGDPMVARLTYLFQPIPSQQESPQKESDYEFIVYGGDAPERQIGYELRAQLPLTVLPALRNAEEDLSNWRKSPLAPLLQSIAAETDPAKFEAAAGNVFKATSEIAEMDGIKTLGTDIKNRLEKMVGSTHAVDTSLNFSPSDPLRLIRSLRLFIDGGLRSISDASLGYANLIYLSLLSLDLERQVAEGNRDHTFLAIEEPEAHLHPHLQRLTFRDFLRSSNVNAGEGNTKSSQSLILTTHSPHIVSIAPLNSLVALKRSIDGKSTIGKSTASLKFDERTTKDLERYIDVNRGECVFAKGLVLVEGTAEEYIVPALGKLLGYDFDQLGISVCSVAGTNFEPYVKLFGPHGLDIPFVVITDRDPQDGKEGLGINRVRKLLSIVLNEDYSAKSEAEVIAASSGNGMYLNDYTFEIDMFQSGNHAVMCQALSETTTNGAVGPRCTAWEQNPAGLDVTQFLKDIEEVGKGRYAQRLASDLSGGVVCPPYIENAITYVAGKIN